MLPTRPPDSFDTPTVSRWRASESTAGLRIGRKRSEVKVTCIFLQIVVFEDGDDDQGRRAPRWRRGEAGDSGAVFLARLLQYCETPQYLRRHLIPMHPDLRTAVSEPIIAGGVHFKPFDPVRLAQVFRNCLLSARELMYEVWPSRGLYCCRLEIGAVRKCTSRSGLQTVFARALPYPIHKLSGIGKTYVCQ